MAELAPLQAELDQLRQSSSLQAVQQEHALHDLARQLEQAQQLAAKAEEELSAARAREERLSLDKSELASELAGERERRDKEDKERISKGKSEEQGDKVRRELVQALERSEEDKDKLVGKLAT